MCIEYGLFLIIKWLDLMVPYNLSDSRSNTLVSPLRMPSHWIHVKQYLMSSCYTDDVAFRTTKALPNTNAQTASNKSPDN